MDRICSQCGEHFNGQSKDTRCPACRKSPVKILRTKTCAACGREYQTFATRSFYCPECAAERKKIANIECKRRKAAGKSRAIGSEDVCVVCGKKYKVEGGLQRYCPDCAHERRNKYALERFYNGGAEQRKARMDARVIATANCVVCGNPFPLDGKRLKCCSKECLDVRRKQLTAAYYQINLQKYKKLWSEWYKKNKDRYLANKKLRAKKQAERNQDGEN